MLELQASAVSLAVNPEILAPWPGIGLPGPYRGTAVKEPSPNHWTTRDVPPSNSFFFLRITEIFY